MSEEINITFESLYDILRQEKKSPELSNLPSNFLENVVDYLKKKNALLNKNKNSLFSNEFDKNRDQLNNILKILKEIYERRERKVIDFALNISRAGINDAAKTLLPFENSFRDELTKLFDKYRKNILMNVLNQKLPNLVENSLPSSSKIKETPSVPAENEDKSEFKLVRFLNPVSQFATSDLKLLGPYSSEDIATLPLEVANLLINNKNAEEISITSDD